MRTGRKAEEDGEVLGLRTIQAKHRDMHAEKQDDLVAEMLAHFDTKPAPFWNFFETEKNPTTEGDKTANREYAEQWFKSKVFSKDSEPVPLMEGEFEEDDTEWYDDWKAALQEWLASRAKSGCRGTGSQRQRPEQAPPRHVVHPV